MAASVFRSLSVACLLGVASFAGTASAATLHGIPVLDVPRINCTGVATQTSIDVNIQAGASGAPFGFIVEWQETRPNGDCPTWGRLDKTCHATFVPLASNSPFGLGPYWQVVVHIGNLDLTNPEITTNCPGPLTCGTSYCFRVKALGGGSIGNRFARSDFSDSISCSTEACPGTADLGSGSQCGQVAIAVCPTPAPLTSAPGRRSLNKSA